MKKPTTKPAKRDEYVQLRLMNVAEDPFYMQEYQPQAVKNIMFDKWGNEWDDMEDFTDMDFRTVDDSE